MKKKAKKGLEKSGYLEKTYKKKIKELGEETKRGLKEECVKTGKRRGLKKEGMSKIILKGYWEEEIEKFR